jgi:magnesium transporter
MAAPASNGGADPSAPQRPTDLSLDSQPTADALGVAQTDQGAPGKRRKNHRGGKKKKSRRQSFLPSTEEDNGETSRPNRIQQEPQDSASARPPFYRLGQSSGRNVSSTSLDSNALLDHR